MNIVVGKENAEILTEKFIVLELDTFKVQGGETITAYCSVENIPLEEMANVSDLIESHNNLLLAYKSKDWAQSTTLINELTGAWGSELDSFYESMLNRVNEYITNDPGDDWDGSIIKNPG